MNCVLRFLFSSIFTIRLDFINFLHVCILPKEGRVNRLSSAHRKYEISAVLGLSKIKLYLNRICIVNSFSYRAGTGEPKIILSTSRGANHVTKQTFPLENKQNLL